MTSQVATFILAGGRGERLLPLTKSRAKPLLPFAGSRSLMDFTLTNCALSRLSTLSVLTCNECIPMNLKDPRVCQESWGALRRKMDGEAWMKALNKSGYLGTGDAVRQNLSEIPRSSREVLILASDHVYTMDYRTMLEFHREKEALVTVGTVTVDLEEAGQFGVVEVDVRDRIQAFKEKPKLGALEGEHAARVNVSMGIYVFDKDFLSVLLQVITGHDFGRDLLPSSLATGRVFAFQPEAYGHGPFLWRDLGTLDSYWASQVEWVRASTFENGNSENRTVEGELGLRPSGPGNLDGFNGRGPHEGSSRPAQAAGHVENTVINPGVIVCSRAEVTDSVLLENSIVHPGARVRRAIVDRGVEVGPFEEIGFDVERDAERYVVSPEGVVVVSTDGPGTEATSRDRSILLNTTQSWASPKQNTLRG